MNPSDQAAREQTGHIPAVVFTCLRPGEVRIRLIPGLADVRNHLADGED